MNSTWDRKEEKSPRATLFKTEYKKDEHSTEGLYYFYGNKIHKNKC